MEERVPLTTKVSSELAKVSSELAKVSSELTKVSSELTKVSSELSKVSSSYLSASLLGNVPHVRQPVTSVPSYDQLSTSQPLSLVSTVWPEQLSGDMRSFSAAVLDARHAGQAGLHLYIRVCIIRRFNRKDNFARTKYSLHAQRVSGLHRMEWAFLKFHWYAGNLATCSKFSWHEQSVVCFHNV